MYQCTRMKLFTENPLKKAFFLHGSGMPKRTLKMVQEQYSTNREKRKGT